MVGGLSCTLLGGRWGNLLRAPTDTRFLRSDEYYHEWGIDGFGRPFDRSAAVAWGYDPWRVQPPARMLFGLRVESAYIDNVNSWTWAGPYYPPFPLSFVDNTKTTNTYMEAHIRGATLNVGYACLEYNLDASRTFSRPNTLAAVYAKTRQMHMERGSPAYLANGDILVGTRSLRKNGFILNYWEGAGMHSIVGEDDPELGSFPYSWSALVPSYPHAGCWVSPGIQWVEPAVAVTELNGNRSNLEVDFYADLGGGMGCIHYPGVLIHWTTILSQAPSASCPGNYAYWGAYNQFTPGSKFHTRRVAIDYEAEYFVGDELACAETTTMAREVVIDPQPPEGLSGPGYREYVADGPCPGP